MRPDMVRTQGLLADVDTLTEELIRSVISGGNSAEAILEQVEKLKRIDQNLQQAEQQLAISRQSITERARRGAFSSRRANDHPWSPRTFLAHTKATFETLDEFDEPDFKKILPRHDSVPITKLEKLWHQNGKIEISNNRRPGKIAPLEKVSSLPLKKKSNPPPRSDHVIIKTNLVAEVPPREISTSPPAEVTQSPPTFWGKRSPIASTQFEFEKRPPMADETECTSMDGDDDSTNVGPSKRSPTTSPRQKVDFIVVKQGWLELREPEDPDKQWIKMWCVLYLNGDFVYYTDDQKTIVKGVFQFLPDSTIHSFDDVTRMEVVPAYSHPDNTGIHFRGANEHERGAWSAAISQPDKYIEVMQVPRRGTSVGV